MITAQEAQNITELGRKNLEKKQRLTINNGITNMSNVGISSYYYFGHLFAEIESELESNGFKIVFEKGAHKISW